MSGVHVSSYERLHAVTSVCERLRALASVGERWRARQVAFSRVWSRQFFFCVRARLGVFCHILSYLVVIFRHFSSFFVISRHFSSFLVPNFFFRVWRETGGCGTGWAGRAAVCSAWFPRRVRDGPNDMTLILSWHTVAAGPRLRLLMFRTIVLQNRGVCSCWEFQGAFQNGGGFVPCSEGQDSQQLSALWLMQSV